MKSEETNTEQAILMAAEKEFLARGYALSKTTEIARAAGVTHAMLHYYYGTKEKLFNKVFEEKAKMIAGSFEFIIDENLSFPDKIAKGVELHFDFLAANPTLPFFIVSEIITHEERKATCRNIFLPIIETTLEKFSQALRTEIAKGTIRSVAPLDLILTIVSLNVFVFIAHPLISMITRADQTFLEHRKKENIEIVLGWLKP